MKKLIIVISSLIIMSIGSFVGTMCHAPCTVKAQDIQYIPILKEPLDSTLIQPKTEQAEQDTKTKYVIRYVKTRDRESEKQLKVANHLIKLLYNNNISKDSLKYTIPEYFADREEKTVNDSHSIQ